VVRPIPAAVATSLSDAEGSTTRTSVAVCSNDGGD
jgi:hypothetical protein